MEMGEKIDSWARDYSDAIRLADDISARLAERNSLGPEASSRLVFTIRRKTNILGTKIDTLQSLLNNTSIIKSVNEKELNRRQDSVVNLRIKMNQMTNNLNAQQIANRNKLLPQDDKDSPIENNRTAGLDNKGIVSLQRQIMKEQDDDLSQLQERIASTKHIALAVNEELDLQVHLLDDLDEETDITGRRLKTVQRKLAIFSKRASSGCSFMRLLSMVFVIVMLIAVIWVLINYL